MRVVIPGGTGFLGHHLSRALVDRGDSVVVLTRGEPSRRNGWQAVQWDPGSPGDWVDHLDNADAIVHLTGKRVDCRPTRTNIDALISSRVEPVLAVGRALAEMDSPPPVWVQVSSLAIFGEGGEEVIDETTEPFSDGPRQMVEVCRRWEAAFDQATAGLERRVLMRAGIGVGGEGDPATARLAILVRLGLGGRIASGKQWVSWVALDDFVAALLRALDQDLHGLYHITSPNPVRNAEMMAIYRRALGRRFGLPSPRWITAAGAWMLGSDPALALTGRRAVPRRLVEEGFEFSTPDFEVAVARAVRDLRD